MWFLFYEKLALLCILWVKILGYLTLTGYGCVVVLAALFVDLLNINHGRLKACI